MLGFTFIEILVALLILSIMLIAIDATFYVTSHKAQKNLHDAIAINQLSNKLEIASNATFSSRYDADRADYFVTHQ